MNLSKCISLTIALLSFILKPSLFLSAQDRDLTGSWFLQERKSVRGKDYINGIPIEIKIEKKGEAFLFQKISYGQNNKRDTTVEMVFLGDKENITKTNRQRSTNFRWLNNQNIFIKIDEVSLPGKGNEIDYIRIDTFELTPDNKMMILTRMHESRIDQNDKWVIRGEYVKKLPGDKWGVQFYESASWREVLKEARKRNKFIFVDCNATWCAPCKKMDSEVFPSKKAGVLLNEHFISIKVQMDKTKKDREYVKKWYRIAELLKTEYHVNAYPTFLFFSPNGKIVHKSQGYGELNQFLDVVKEALNPQTQYYTLLNEYRKSVYVPKNLWGLALKTKAFKEDSLALEIADRYFEIVGDKVINEKDGLWFLNLFKASGKAQAIAETYFRSLSEKELYTEKNLQLLYNFTQSSKSFGFKVFYNEKEKVDKILPVTWSTSKVQNIITEEEINSRLRDNGKDMTANPDWDYIRCVIQQKYGEAHSDKAIIDAQLIWFENRKDWSAYCKTVIKRVNRYGPFGFGGKDRQYNNVAWTLFEHSTNNEELQIALTWNDSSIAILNRNKSNDLDRIVSQINLFDTKANILYKLHRDKEAIHLMAECQRLYESWCEKQDKPKKQITSYSIALNKMRKGEPTWPIE